MNKHDTIVNTILSLF